MEALKSRPGCVGNALQQALLRTGTLLNTSIHPYHSNLHDFEMVTCEIGSLLNPSLSATWVRAVLEPPGIASTVLTNLKAEYGIVITKNTLIPSCGKCDFSYWAL